MMATESINKMVFIDKNRESDNLNQAIGLIRRSFSEGGKKLIREMKGAFGQMRSDCEEKGY